MTSEAIELCSSREVRPTQVQSIISKHLSRNSGIPVPPGIALDAELKVDVGGIDPHKVKASVPLDALRLGPGLDDILEANMIGTRDDVDERSSVPIARGLPAIESIRCLQLERIGEQVASETPLQVFVHGRVPVAQAKDLKRNRVA